MKHESGEMGKELIMCYLLEKPEQTSDQPQLGNYGYRQQTESEFLECEEISR